jgi:hypothetical protein
MFILQYSITDIDKIIRVLQKQKMKLLFLHFCKLKPTFFYYFRKKNYFPSTNFTRAYRNGFDMAVYNTEPYLVLTGSRKGCPAV